MNAFFSRVILTPLLLSLFACAGNDNDDPDADAVAADKAELQIQFNGNDSESMVTQNINLVSFGPSGTSISWLSTFSSNGGDASGVISNSGQVTRPQNGSDALVKLTATISKGVATDIKIFNLVVKELKFVDWCITQFPQSITAGVNEPISVYGRVYVYLLTDQTVGNDLDVDLVAAVGYGPVGSPPDIGEWTWIPASANPNWDGSIIAGALNDDEYVATLSVPNVGNYDFAYRFSYDAGNVWTYCDTNGSTDGYQTANAGDLTIQ